MDPKNFIGDKIQLDCGEAGIYVGKVKSINPKDQTITISDVSVSNKPWLISDLTIKGQNVKELKLLEKAKELEQKSLYYDDASSLRKDISQPEEAPRITRRDAGDPDYYHKLKSQALTSKYQTRSPKQQSSTSRKGSGKPQFDDGKTVYKGDNEQCFGKEADSPTQPDFDFEKNLALFNKQAIFENMKDKVPLQKVKTFKGNENVLESEPISLRQIKVPLEHVGKEYSTDYGFVVPAISLELRKRLFSAAERAGLTLHQRVENGGVCACQMALQLVGGSLRICPKNAHQAPEVVVLVGPHTEGLTAVCTARHLANHTVRVNLLCPEKNVLLQKQLELFLKSGGRLIRSVNDLPTQPVDLVIDALVGHDDPGLDYNWVPWAVQWANKKGVPILSIDPYIHPTSSITINSKWSLAMALPLISSPRSGRLFLADLGIPRGIFKEIGISYESPFGDKFVIPLHG